MPRPTCHAFSDDALGDHDAVALGELVARGERSAESLVEAAIQRMEAVEPTLHAVAVGDAERARARSRAPASGPFAGVPTLIKDMIAMEGLPTRFGSNAFRNAQPKERSDPFAQQMFEMGMIGIGKSTMPEFGFTPSTEFPDAPPTCNPWNVERSAGGSSGGAAALVAAGVVPIAHAADGGGSIRIPAACCGLVGLKTTADRLVPSQTTKSQIVPIVTDGVVTRSVRDTAVYLAEAEARYRAPKLAPIGRVEAPIDRPLRIGIAMETPADVAIDAPTRSTFESAAKLLESLGHHVEAFPLPVDERFADDFRLLWSFLAWGGMRTGKSVFDPSFEREHVTDFTRGLAAAFRNRFLRALFAVWRLRRSKHAYNRALAGVDCVMTPTVAHLAPPHGVLGMDLPFETLFPRVESWAGFTPWANATGAPSISLPLGFDEDSGLPIGMMFGAKHGDERILLELAFQLEAAQPWPRLGARAPA